MKLNRGLVFVLYAMALLLMLPIIEALVSVLPARPGETAWRFGAFGMLTRVMMTPLLGLVVLAVVAFLLRHAVTLRVVSVLALISGLGLLVALGLFGLDAIEMRAQVRPEAMSSFDMATVIAVVKTLAAAVIGLVLGVAGWKAARSSQRHRRDTDARSPLVART